jgi:hypothetical protein
MAGLRVVSGVGNNNFDPNGQLTREQAATMLSRLAHALDRPFDSYTPTFSDNGQIASWAFNAVGELQNNGIITGVGENRFNPKGNYERQQAIITMLRMYEYMKPH